MFVYNKHKLITMNIKIRAFVIFTTVRNPPPQYANTLPFCDVKVNSLSVFTPGDGRLRVAPWRTALQQGRLPLCHPCVLWFSPEVVPENCKQRREGSSCVCCCAYILHHAINSYYG